MLMASRLIYGMATQDVLPRSLGKVLPHRRSPYTAIAFTTALALGLIVVVRLQAESTIVSGARRAPPRCCCSRCSPWSTSPAWCCAATRRSDGPSARPPRVPVLGAISCAYLLGPWARLEADMSSTGSRPDCSGSAWCCG